MFSVGYLGLWMDELKMLALARDFLEDRRLKEREITTLTSSQRRGSGLGEGGGHTEGHSRWNEFHRA